MTSSTSMVHLRARCGALLKCLILGGYHCTKFEVSINYQRFPPLATISGGPVGPLRLPLAADAHCVCVLQAWQPTYCRPSGLPAAFCTWPFVDPPVRLPVQPLLYHMTSGTLRP